jgi:hypothetical protein
MASEVGFGCQRGRQKVDLAGDVVATRQIISQAKGPVVPVSHSHGGVVITETGNDPKVLKLVYMTAFAPDKAQSVASLIKDPPPEHPPITPPQDGHLLLVKTNFADSFAADLDAKKAALMADSQIPWGVGGLEGAVTEPAWRKKPSGYLVAIDDRMIPHRSGISCSGTRAGTVVESKGSHAVYVSKPDVVGSIIKARAPDAANTPRWLNRRRRN